MTLSTLDRRYLVWRWTCTYGLPAAMIAPCLAFEFDVRESVVRQDIATMDDWNDQLPLDVTPDIDDDRLNRIERDLLDEKSREERDLLDDLLDTEPDDEPDLEPTESEVEDDRSDLVDEIDLVDDGLDPETLAPISTCDDSEPSLEELIAALNELNESERAREDQEEGRLGTAMSPPPRL